MVTLAIISGGDSRRMGQDKTLMPFRGIPLVQRVLERLAPLADEVILSTNRPDKFSFLGLRMVTDLLPGHGSLGGVYTCLSIAQFPFVAAAACDLPFANLELFSYEVSLMREGDFDVVVPCSAGGLEPLHAVYRRETCLPLVKKALSEDNNKMMGWFGKAKVIEIPYEKVMEFDPEGLVFLNLNTPDEFARAEEIARRIDN